MLDLQSYTLSVHADPLADGLVRLLNLVALQPVSLARVHHDQAAHRATTVLDFSAAEPGRADLLAARLRQAVWVRDVQLQAIPPAPPRHEREQ